LYINLYNVKFEEKWRPAIPDFIEANELNTYKLELPAAGAVENLSLKRNSDSPIVISSKDDVENILSILEETEPTAESSGIGIPVRVENIINVDFISKANVICRLFLYEDGENILLSRRTMEYIQSQKRIMIR